MRRLLLPLALLLLAAPLLSACESTFDKAKRAHEEAGTVEQVTSADMTQMSGAKAEVEGVFASADGSTAAVVVKITTDKGTALLWPQIQIDVLDAAGKVIGTNNIPGALPELIHVPSAPGGASSTYVNDQILISGKPASAKVVLDGAPFSGDLPAPLTTTPPKVTQDSAFGASWTTTITNSTGVRQESVIAQVVVRKGGKAVGAGTAVVQGGLDPGAKADVTGYFIGASDGDVEVFVPASNAKDGSGAPAPGASTGGGATSAPTSSGGGASGTGTGLTAPAATLQIG